MSDTAITVDKLGKRYLIGAGHTDVLAERLQRIVTAPARALRGRNAVATSHMTTPHDTERELWALRDVSLEIERGEAVGLIGANGAGKSTLLKLLSRITLPTEGRITLRGQVATLLEVGTGFHPELSGRENIFINGAILGMRRREIESRFDEIVEFSGIERFIDTPVKRYSSGMYVRLAFAVAAHLETDILLADEVLAVGDTAFQRKCLGKMQEVAEHGRTVVFVSHNLSAVQRLCRRAYWIGNGHIRAEGSTSSVIAAYMRESGLREEPGKAVIGPGAHRMGSGEARLLSIELVNGSGQTVNQLALDERFGVRMHIEVYEPIDEALIELGLSSPDGTRVITSYNVDGSDTPFALEPGRYDIHAWLGVALLPGDLQLNVGLHRLAGPTLDHVEALVPFSVLNTTLDGSVRYPVGVSGAVRPDSEWSISVGSPLARTNPVGPIVNGAGLQRLCAENVELTAICDADLPRLFEWINDREQVLLNANYSPVHEQDHLAWFENVCGRPDVVIFAIRALSDCELIGSCQLINVDRRHGTADLQIRIGARDARGKGYGTEAVKLLLSHAFRDLRLERVQLHVFANNDRAIRAYQKAGLRQEGVLRSAAYIDGERCDVIVMGILRDEAGVA